MLSINLNGSCSAVTWVGLSKVIALLVFTVYAHLRIHVLHLSICATRIARRIEPCFKPAYFFLKSHDVALHLTKGVGRALQSWWP